ncbi:MAG TPA: tetratricopeptide repeat protein [Candidatus Limnocylindria bacterium]|nr:tetratricopeptide repeat protein [Candidatus Limnocylindria bacterium]
MPQATRQRRAVPESPALRQLGERLREARTAAGLSQAQLGAPYYTRAHVSAIELGKIRPAMKSLEHMAAKLGKPASYFLEDERAEKTRREIEYDVDRVCALAGRVTAAECIRQSAETLEREDLGVRQRCRLHLARARVFNLSERPADAVRDLTVAQRLATQLKDEPLLIAIEYETGASALGAGEFPRARDLLSALLSKLERSNDRDRLLRMRVLQALGAVSLALGEPKSAFGYLNAALEWAQDIGDLAGLFAIYYALAAVYRSQGDMEAAASYVQRALAITEASKDLTATAMAHNLLAVIAAENGHIEAAYRHADRALEVGRAAGPDAYVAHILVTKSECAVKLGDFDAAQRFADEAFDVAKRSGNKEAIASVRVIFSQLLARKGEHASSDRELQEAAALYRAEGARAELAEVLMRLSRSAKARGDLEDAERYATLAFEAMRSAPSFVEVKK